MSNAQKVDDGVGLSDSLRPEHQSARGPSALSLSGFGCLAVVADPSKRRCLGECWVRRLRTRGPHRRALARERKGGKRPRHAQFRLRARAVISTVRTRPLLVVVEAAVVNGAVETAGPHRPTSGPPVSRGLVSTESASPFAAEAGAQAERLGSLGFPWRRGNCRPAPSDIRPARISGLGKYGKRFPVRRRSRRAGRETRIAGISERLGELPATDAGRRGQLPALGNGAG